MFPLPLLLYVMLYNISNSYIKYRYILYRYIRNCYYYSRVNNTNFTNTYGGINLWISAYSIIF